MNVPTISNLFAAVSRLEHAVTQVAGKDAMSEETALMFLSMINTCTHAANVALELANQVTRAPMADSTPYVITHAQALDMDETAGIYHEQRSA